jgi:two-component system LytT family response regulator
MISVAIVEDEPLPARRLRRMLEKHPDVRVVGEAKDGAEALRLVESAQPDALFLDIHLPDMSGFDLLAKIAPERWPLVVFVTAYDEFALQAFDVHAIDYLLKPFDETRVRRALGRVRERLAAPARAAAEAAADLAELRAAIEELRRQQAGAQHASEIAVRSRGEITIVPVERIDWIGSADNYVEIHVGEATHLVRRSLASLEGRLDPRRFLRVHRQSIVNADRVRTVRQDESGDLEIELDGGTRLPVGRAFRVRLAERWEGFR